MVATGRDFVSLGGTAVTDGAAGSAHLDLVHPTAKIGENRGSDMDAATRIVLHLVSARQNLMCGLLQLLARVAAAHMKSLTP